MLLCRLCQFLYSTLSSSFDTETAGQTIMDRSPLVILGIVGNRNQYNLCLSTHFERQGLMVRRRHGRKKSAICFTIDCPGISVWWWWWCWSYYYYCYWHWDNPVQELASHLLKTSKSDMLHQLSKTRMTKLCRVVHTLPVSHDSAMGVGWGCLWCKSHTSEWNVNHIDCTVAKRHCGATIILQNYHKDAWEARLNAPSPRIMVVWFPVTTG